MVDLYDGLYLQVTSTLNNDLEEAIKERIFGMFGTKEAAEEALGDYILEMRPPVIEQSTDLEDRWFGGIKLRVVQQFRIRPKTKEEKEAENANKRREGESSSGEDQIKYGAVELSSEGYGFENGSWAAPS